jgi:hypothetical protein
MRFYRRLTRLRSLIRRYNFGRRRGNRAGMCPVLWLIVNLRLYLKGFCKRGIVAKARKNSQESCGQKIGARALTTPALSTIRSYGPAGAGYVRTGRTFRRGRPDSRPELSSHTGLLPTLAALRTFSRKVTPMQSTLQHKPAAQRRTPL